MRCWILVVLSSSLLGCAEDVALSVGDVSFAGSELLGLSETQETLLSTITAVGLATARGEAVLIGAPILERRREEHLIERLRQETTLEREQVTESVLETRYSQRPEYELTVRHLVVLSERWRPSPERDEARRKAEAALVRAQAGEPFPELAGEVSEEPGAEARGGLLEPGREGSWVTEFWEAANALEVGEVSGVVESEYGFHVLRLDDRQSVPFEEARPRVVAELATLLDDPEAWQRQVTEWTGASATDPQVDPAVRSVLLEQAALRNLSVAAPDDARILRQWEFQLAAWAASFGFRPGMSSDEIGEQALAALGSTDQNARIAREQIVEYEDALLGAYPIVVADS